MDPRSIGGLNNLHSFKQFQKKEDDQNHSEGFTDKYRGPESLAVVVNGSELAATTDNPQERENTNAKPAYLTSASEIQSK